MTGRMGQNICKLHIGEKVNIQNIFKKLQLNNKNLNNPIKNRQRTYIAG